MLIDNIGTLVTNDPELGTIENAAIVFGDGVVQWAGPRSHDPAGAPANERFDAGGRAVIPGFVDSHGHLVFAGDRAHEFAARMAGEPYEAGGIRTTVEATRNATDDAARRERGPAGRRGAALRHHDRRDQVRLRPDRPRRAPQPHDRHAAHRRDEPSWAPTWSRPSTTPTPTSSS